jgi:tetratricopeptide (TPR) repeat protein
MLGNILLGALLGPFVIFGIVVGITSLSGRGASVLYMPSGFTTPRRKEFSRAKALEVRGELHEAIREYQEAIRAAPEDAEPYLRIARLCRDDLRDPDAAVQWFRRAQREARLSEGQVIRVHRELAEIFLYSIGQSRKAAPELARLAEAYPSTADGRWAALELAHLKEEMARERVEDGGGRGREEDPMAGEGE